MGPGSDGRSVGRGEHMPGKYYIVADGAKRGPYGKHELESLGLRRETLVWRKGLPDWVAAGRVPELLDVFDEPPPLPGAAPPPAPAPEPGAPPPPTGASEQFKDPA